MTEEFELTYEEHKQAVQLSYKSRLISAVRIVSYILFSLILFYCLFIGWYLKDTRILSLGFAAVCGAFLGFLIKPMVDKKYYGSKSAVRERTIVSTSESGVSFKTDKMEISYSWEQVFKWRIDRDVILIFRDAKQYDVVPRRLALADEIQKTLLRYKGQPT